VNIQWDERPSVSAYLLNPAYLGLLLREAVDGYVSERDAGMPFALAFIVPVLTLHPKTLERLPNRITTSFHGWLQDEANRDIVVELDHRVSSLMPAIKEAILFASERGVIGFDDNGLLIAGRRRITGKAAFQRSSDEIAATLKATRFVGRWLSAAGSVATVYTLLGLRP